MVSGDILIEFRSVYTSPGGIPESLGSIHTMRDHVWLP